jgi:superfamily II DNA or RNA helicase
MTKSIEKGLFDWYEDDLDKLNPYKSFRPGQKEVIKNILNAFESGKRFVILQLPTGAGKSVIAYIVSKILESSYFITSSKMLQDQYARDFHDLSVVKGRSNFNCLMKNATCAAFEENIK